MGYLRVGRGSRGSCRRWPQKDLEPAEEGVAGPLEGSIFLAPPLEPALEWDFDGLPLNE